MATEADNKWHLKREIQLGHIITTLCVAASAFFYVTKLEQRIAIMESQIEAQKERDTYQDQRSADMFKLLYERLDKIDSKLDRLVERKDAK